MSVLIKDHMQCLCLKQLHTRDVPIIDAHLSGYLINRECEYQYSNLLMTFEASLAAVCYNYHRSPTGIQSGNRRWYGLVYLVYKNAGSPRARPRKQ